MTACERDLTTPREKFIELRGLRFHYLEWGDIAAPPLLMVHGGASSARGTWTFTAPSYASNFHIIAPDHRGHGETDWDPDARYSMSEYVADLAALVDALRLPPFFVIAHSMGGFITLAYAAEHAESIRGLVLVDAAPRYDDPPLQMRGNPWAARPLTFESRDEAEAFARARMPEAARGRSLGYGFIDLPDGKVTWRTDIAGLSRARKRLEEDPEPQPMVNAGAVFASARFPILLLRAGASAGIPLESVAKLQAANPRATIISYDAAYHWLHQDEPERFDADVWAFFEPASVGNYAPQGGKPDRACR
jgi:pimeloyl-ACP methyl ester carboxylesterase